MPATAAAVGACSSTRPTPSPSAARATSSGSVAAAAGLQQPARDRAAHGLGHVGDRLAVGRRGLDLDERRALGPPRRGVAARAQVDHQLPRLVGQRLGQRRPPPRGQPAARQRRQPRADREPVGRDAVLQRHDAPQRRGDQHLLARPRRVPPQTASRDRDAETARRCRPRRPAPRARSAAQRRDRPPQLSPTVSPSVPECPRCALPPASLTSAASALARRALSSSAKASDARSTGSPPSGARLPSEGGNRTSSGGAGR